MRTVPFPERAERGSPRAPDPAIDGLLGSFHDATDEEIEFVYAKMCGQPFALDDMLKANGPVVISRIARARTTQLFRIVRDGVFGGLVGATSIIPLRDAEAQITIWDRRLLRLVRPLGLVAMGAIFEAFGLERASALIPEPNFAARRYAEEMGFKREGASPRVFKFGGEFYPGLRYGIVRSEALRMIEEAK